MESARLSIFFLASECDFLLFSAPTKKGPLIAKSLQQPTDRPTDRDCCYGRGTSSTFRPQDKHLTDDGYKDFAAGVPTDSYCTIFYEL